MSDEKAAMKYHEGPIRRFRFWFAMVLYRLGWCTKVPQNSLRKRIHAIVSDRHRWWDWGHPLMVLVGHNIGGNWDEYEPPTWFYRFGAPGLQRYTKFPTHGLKTIEIVKDYKTFRALTEGFNEDQMYEWKAIGTNQDRDLHLGHQFWGGTFYDLNYWEMKLVRKYLNQWRRHDWYGLRSWLYKQALHNAVDGHNPFSCGFVPPRGSGGYSHWHCQLKRKHNGKHRFGNYIYGEGEARVEYEPI